MLCVFAALNVKYRPAWKVKCGNGRVAPEVKVDGDGQ